MSGLINWSTDPSSNDISDPPILWQEGQPAPTVNNSAREMMAALAKWRDDNSGALTAVQSGNDVYSLATEQVFSEASRASSHTLSFLVSDVNRGPVKLAVDNLAGVPLRRQGNIELAPDDLELGVLYRVSYVPSVAAYLIVSPAIAKPDTIEVFGSPEPPKGWLTCDGRAVSRTIYSALFDKIGLRFGGGDGSTTFNIPDIRGRAVYGLDGGVGRLTSAGGLLGVFGSVGGSETVTLTEAQLASHAHGGTTSAAGGHDHGGAVAANGQHTHGGATGGSGSHNHTGSTSGAGAHAHTGSTDASGAHVHPINYNRASNYNTGTGGSGVAVLNIYPAPINSGGQTDNDGTSSGLHSHALTTSDVGDHAHGFTTGTVADHAHSISADGQHAHGITAVGDHSHTVTITTTGSGQAHSNMPPGIVLTFAIKA